MGATEKGLENIKKAGFGANPQNINRKGRPRKSFRTINDKLKRKGVEPMQKSHLLDAYALIFNLKEEELKVLMEDKETPYVLKLIILELSDKSTRAKAIGDFRDYTFGRAKESTDVKVTIEQPLFSFDDTPELKAGANLIGNNEKVPEAIIKAEVIKKVK